METLRIKKRLTHTRILDSDPIALPTVWMYVAGALSVLAFLIPSWADASEGLRGTFYDGMNFDTYISTAIDTTINFNPADTVIGVNRANGGDTFSARWTGYVKADHSETYTFYTYSDDGVRLYVNDTLVIDNWTNHGPTENSGSITLSAGAWYPIRLEFYENGGGAVITLSYSSASVAKTIIPSSNLMTGKAFTKPANNLGLVGYWSFNEGAGTVATDFSGKDNEAVLSGNPGWGHGKQGAAIALNGSTQSGTIGDVAELRITGDQTISMWLKPTAFSARRNPYAKAYGGEGTITQETNGKLNYYYGTNGGNNTPYQGFSTNGSVALNTWTHITIVRDLTNMTLRWYINGELDNTVGAAYAAATAGSNPAYIGSGYVSPYAGSIDEVRIYNRALSASEVAQLYRAGAILLGASSAELHQGSSLESGLVGHWTFDGGDTNWTSDTAGTTADRSGSGNTGTLTSMNRRTSVEGGVLGQALVFDGVDDFVQMSNSNSLEIGTESMGWGMWFKSNATTRGIVYRKSGGANVNGVLIDLNATVAGKVRCYIHSPAVTVLSAESVYNDGQWHHAACVLNRDASTLKLYVDGGEVASEDASSLGGIDLTAGVSAYIGVGGGFNFPGSLDDVRAYNRALSASEIKQLYNLGRATVQP